MALTDASWYERIPLHSRVLLAAAVVFAVMGVAGVILGSFAYPLALLLAVLCGVVGVASAVATGPGQRGLLFGLTVALLVAITYLFVVSGGGGPPSPVPSR